MQIEFAGDKEKVKKVRVHDNVRRGGTIHELISAYRHDQRPGTTVVLPVHLDPARPPPRATLAILLVISSVDY
jgi:hypothetical protein